MATSSSIPAGDQPTSLLNHRSLPNGFPLLSTTSHHQPRRRPWRSSSFSCSLKVAGPSGLGRLWSAFNRSVQTNTRGSPVIGLFGSIGLSPEGAPGEAESSGVAEDNGLPYNGVEIESPRKVLILMTDTGGGHRASAEAIKAAFHSEFGEDYQVFITDLCTDQTPWPFNQLPRSCSFLVKHGPLWRMTYYGSAPRMIHHPHFAATSAFIATFSFPP